MPTNLKLCLMSTFAASRGLWLLLHAKNWNEREVVKVIWIRRGTTRNELSEAGIVKSQRVLGKQPNNDFVVPKSSILAL